MACSHWLLNMADGLSECPCSSSGVIFIVLRREPGRDSVGGGLPCNLIVIRPSHVSGAFPKRQRLKNGDFVSPHLAVEKGARPFYTPGNGYFLKSSSKLPRFTGGMRLSRAGLGIFQGCSSPGHARMPWANRLSATLLPLSNGRAVAWNNLQAACVHTRKWVLCLG